MPISNDKASGYFFGDPFTGEWINAGDVKDIKFKFETYVGRNYRKQERNAHIQQVFLHSDGVWRTSKP